MIAEFEYSACTELHCSLAGSGHPTTGSATHPQSERENLPFSVDSWRRLCIAVNLLSETWTTPGERIANPIIPASKLSHS